MDNYPYYNDYELYHNPAKLMPNEATYNYIMNNPNSNYRTMHQDLPLATAFVRRQPYAGMVPVGEGLRRGSIFSNLYKPYLDQIPVQAMDMMYDEKREWMRAIQQLSFALLDLNLYLDNNPKNNKALDEYNRLNKELKDITKKYESKYGPITIRSESLDDYPWQWINEPWPWDLRYL